MTSSPDRLLAEFQRLYRQLQALPRRETPDVMRKASPAYRSLEAQIRTVAQQHTAATTTDDEEKSPLARTG